MKAAWYERTGPARDVLQTGELEDPEPASGEVRVRLHASGVNPSDTKRRSGWLGMKMPWPRVVPHSDGAGVIDAAGEDVHPELIGRRVWVWNAQGGDRAIGTAAELVALPAELVAPLPDEIDFEAGSCLGVPGCTAHFAVLSDGPVEGLDLLIAGGAGAVGHAAVQIARLSGARVIATVSSEEKAAVARDAGADVTVDYTREDVAERVRDWTDGSGVDRIIEVDFGANLEPDSRVIRPNGTIASYSSTRDPTPTLPYYALARLGVTVRFIQGFLLPGAARRAAVDDLNRWIAAGELAVRVAGRFPLDEIVLAHEAVEAGDVIGNVVITMG